MPQQNSTLNFDKSWRKLYLGVASVFKTKSKKPKWIPHLKQILRATENQGKKFIQLERI